MPRKFEMLETNAGGCILFQLQNNGFVLATSDLKYLHKHVFVDYNPQLFIGAKVKLHNAFYTITDIRTFTSYRPDEQQPNFARLSGKKNPYSHVIVVEVEPVEPADI